MLLISNFRHQIILSVSITFILIWVSGVWFFKGYMINSFEKDQKIKYDIDNNLINFYFNDFSNGLKKTLNNISGKINQEKYKKINILDTINNIINKNQLNSDSLKVVYYDKRLNYKSTSGEINFFSIQDEIPKEILKKIQNLLEGKSFIYCKNTCRFYYIKPAFNNRFDKGLLQVSASISYMLNEMLKKIPNSDILIIKRIEEKSNITISGKNYTFDLTTSMMLYEKIKNNLSLDNSNRKEVEINNAYIYLNYISLSKFNGIKIITVRDTSSTKRDLKGLYQKYLLSSGFTLVFIIAIFIFFLRIPIKRLNRLSRMLTIIGEGEFNRARSLLEKTKRKNTHDELDMIHNVTHQLTKQLESMHVSLKSSNKELTEKVKEITYLADHDVLTGLFNRRRFNQELDYIVSKKVMFSLVSIDMNHFKLVNDSMGHHVGDNLLISFSKVLNKVLGEVAITGRMGGDEFSAILFEHDREKIALTLDRLVEQVTSISLGSNMILKVSCSIGVSIYPEDTTDLEELTTFSDAAMYENKRFKNNDFNFYTGHETLLKEEQESQYWNRVTRDAISNNLIKLVFHPIVSTKTHEIHAYEVLSRIKNKNQLTSPSYYMHHLEKNRMIVQYDRAVVDLSFSAGSKHAISPGL